ncbi:ATP P2X receptor [Aureococcus anophagefferens]|nr:ATP P2X receptor [Aureococcus anophagefferens]
MVCPSHLFGRDVDDVFSYSTIKYVQIRDRRLGLTKLLLTLASSLPYAGNKRTCEFYEQIGAQQTMDSSLLVSTRITTLEQRLVCNATHGPATCPQVYAVASERTNYVMAAERFTVLIDHSVLATSIRHLQGTSSALSGRLYVKKSHALCEAYGGSVETKTAPCYIRPNTTSRGLDFFSLDVLLRADDVSLDDVSYDGKTYRETGASLIFEITYQNFRGWPGVGEIFYSYTPMVLTTSLTLFATATVLTDFLAIYVLPDRNHYNDYKYEVTPDFSDMRHELEERERGLLAGQIQASDLYRPPDDPDAAPDPRRSADGAITDWHDEA